MKIVRDVFKNPVLITKDIVNDVKTSGSNTSTKTVTRCFHRACNSKKTPLLKAKHIKCRSAYARSCLEHQSKYWNSVLWSNETKQELFGHMNCCYMHGEK